MKQILKTHWIFVVITVVLSIFYFWGIRYIPFHPDESTQLYMSSDFESLFTNPSSLYWQPDKQGTLRQNYRELDAPLTKYILGLGRVLAGRDAISTDWDWSSSWEENLSSGAHPDEQLFMIGRGSITVLLPFSLLFMYFIGKQIDQPGIAILSVILFGTHAVALLHGRRAMAEGTLLFGVCLSTWTILKAKDYPWLAGIGLSIAYNAKQSTLALLPVALIALIWIDGYAKHQIKKILTNLFIFSIVFIIITLALNPLYWNHPMQAFQASLSARQELVDKQIQDTILIAPDKHLETPIQRLFILFVNLYISPPEYGLVGNLAQTRPELDAYITIPGHNLFRGIIWGGIFLVLSLFGIIMAMRSIWVGNFYKQRCVSLLLLATLFQTAFIVTFVPFTWIRYSVPMIPFASFWLAFGIACLVPRNISSRINNLFWNRGEIG